MKDLIRRLTADERGATAIEYGLIAALIFLVALTAMSLMGANATAMFEHVASSIVGAGG